MLKMIRLKDFSVYLYIILNNMDFCNVCDNLLQLAMTEENTLVQICRSCKLSNPCDESFNACVHKRNYGGNERVFYECFVNKYTKFDPTLPHTSTIQCLNKKCKSYNESNAISNNENIENIENFEKTENTEKIENKENIPPDVIYIRFNDVDMKYIYLCCHCDSAWIQTQNYQNREYINVK
jgi:hypothetical protein